MSALACLLVTAAALVAGLGLRLTSRHAPARTERGALAGRDAPRDVVLDAAVTGMGWTGDTLVFEVCRCGATRELGMKAWDHFFCRRNPLVRTNAR